MTDENYKLKASGFISIRGVLDYIRNSCDYETKKRASLIIVYNTILFWGLIISTFKTLEAFLE